MGLVSLIVPIYNSELYLNECIKSILNQTYKNIEVLLIDDGSTDRSLDICNTFEKKDKRIKTITQKNQGVSEARNQGLNKASGEYICFVDSDDTLKKNYVEVLYNEIISNHVDVVFCNFKFGYNNKYVKKKPRLASGIYTTKEVLKKIIDDGTMSGILFGSVCTAIYKKNIIDKNRISFSKDIKINEDGLFNIEYCLNMTNFKVLSDNYLYIYRQNDDSATKTYIMDESILEEATQELIKICNTSKIDINLNEQLEARKVSIAFWEILRLCNKNNLVKYNIVIRKLKKILTDKSLLESYQYIDLKNINKYKYIYYYLMKNNMYKTIYFLTKYIYPLLSSKLSR